MAGMVVVPVVLPLFETFLTTYVIPYIDTES
jgi:hypothetical protein